MSPALHRTCGTAAGWREQCVTAGPSLVVCSHVWHHLLCEAVVMGGAAAWL